MAIISHGSGYLMLSLKVLLVSTGVLSAVVMLKLSMPLIMEFTLSDLPSVWSFMVSCLKPPYLYVVINCIIITIVASSKFQFLSAESSAVPDTVVAVRPELLKVPAALPADYEYGYSAISSVAKVPADFPTDYVVMPEREYGYGVISSVAKVPEYDLYGNVEATISETETMTTVQALDEMNRGDEIVISRSSLAPLRIQPTELSVPSQKPPCSARFANRKSVKASPEVGRALGVSKPKKHDTLENTWKTITDGRPMPLTRHLRKSDTWETKGRLDIPQPEKEQNQKMAKSETFNDRSSASRSNKSLLSPSPGPGKLRKEPSLSQDELNRRVEAFINKFNEDMRLQRQESLNQYMEMINRGAH